MRVSSHYPTTVQIDGEPLRLLIRRLTRDEWIEFASEFERMETFRRGTELVLDRRSGEETLTDDDVRAKRLMELSSEERERRLQEERAESRRSTVFGTEAIGQYVTAAPDALYDDDKGAYVTDGTDIVQLFSTRHDVLSTLLAEIFIQNRLPADAKKNLLLLRASRPGSSDSSTAPGKTPDSTAESADDNSSAPAAAATASPEPSPSGSTDRLN